MERHGVYVRQSATETATPDVAESGIPFIVGTAPSHAAETPAKAGTPVLVNDWADAVEKLGYSDRWDRYTLCEAMYSQFKLFGCGPAIFVNVLDPEKEEAQEELSEDSIAVTDHRAKLPFEAVAKGLKVAKTGDEETFTEGTDYAVIYDYADDACYVELLSGGKAYGESALKVTGKKVKTDSVTKAEVIAGIDTVGRCVNTTGTIPDLILAPGWSHEKDVAALMATKAAAISGHFVAKALVDLGCGEGGAKTFDAVQAEKEKNALADRAQVVCWPMVTWEGKRCHLSVRIAGLLARRDRENGSPYDSPSNLPIYIDGACLEDGTEVTLSVEEANTVESAGVVTVLNFVNGWTSWGNFTAAHDPAKAVADEDPKDVLISTGRMLDWIGNTVQKTFWDRVDRPMTRIFVDAIVDATNIWLGGLVGNALLGARVDAPDSMNPPKELEAGHVQVKIAEASPPPARIIDFVTEFDRSLVSAAFAE